MSKININNQLPVSINVSYTSTDNRKMNQSVGARKVNNSIKELKANTDVKVSTSNNSKGITYEDGHRNLVVRQEGSPNDFGLNWQ
ncbi:hypothetical protein [Flagellimonas sp. GZD32]|uniref:hypothetical protein n=1 Tax=Flagellimonas cixiensis TaxID=3228750 RepID=UPI0035C8E4FC